MAVLRRGLLLSFFLLLLACDLCAADAGVLPGSDLGVAQQVNQVQRKLHDVQDKLEAAGKRLASSSGPTYFAGGCNVPPAPEDGSVQMLHNCSLISSNWYNRRPSFWLNAVHATISMDKRSAAEKYCLQESANLAV